MRDGRYGPYVNWGKINATLPKDADPQSITVEKALELIAEKAAKSGKGKTKAKTTRKKTTRKPAASRKNKTVKAEE